MQTFLPFPDYIQSAQCLDNKRLNKQIVEVSQLLDGLLLGKYWKKHPAAKMWAGHESELLKYGKVCIKEAQSRGLSPMSLDQYDNLVKPCSKPDWFGWEPFHQAHQSNLYFKDLDHYSQFKTGLALEYLWPIGPRIQVGPARFKVLVYHWEYNLNDRRFHASYYRGGN